MGSSVDELPPPAANRRAWLGSVHELWSFPQMPNQVPSYFHLHLISDATGETLTTMAKAAAVQYARVRAIEHVHPLVRTEKQLARSGSEPKLPLAGSEPQGH